MLLCLCYSACKSWRRGQQWRSCNNPVLLWSTASRTKKHIVSRSIMSLTSGYSHDKAACAIQFNGTQQTDINSQLLHISKSSHAGRRARSVAAHQTTAGASRPLSFHLTPPTGWVSRRMGASGGLSGSTHQQRCQHFRLCSLCNCQPTGTVRRSL